MSREQARGGALLNPVDFGELASAWVDAKPFSHLVVDNFLNPDTALKIVEEFPAFDDKAWYVYNNPVELKKALNNWDRFGPATYHLFWHLNSEPFLRELEKLTHCRLYPDFGLNGGGLHSHRRGGKLNTHLDYSIHPKLGLERRLNLLVYVTPGWQESWGGCLELWEGDGHNDRPVTLIKSVAPVFNRAVLFDTTQNSWHGLPQPIACPPSVARNSVAVYYLCDRRPNADSRSRALFGPSKEQVGDPAVLEIIRKRASISDAASVYET